MIAASQGQGEVKDTSGVISGHAYSVIEIHEFTNNGQNVRLLKLRNPWGQGEWQGDWSDNSKLWTPELRKKVGCEVKDDGFFFIPLADYINYYSSTSICMEDAPEKYKHYNFYHSFSKDTSPKPQAFFKITLSESIDLSKQCFAISAIQQGDRLNSYRSVDEAKKFKPS